MSQEEGVRRKRRLSRWWLLAVLPVILIPLAWLVFGIVGQHNVSAYAQKAKAAGQPTTWEELLGKPIPDEQNAATLYESLGNDPAVQAMNGRTPSLPMGSAANGLTGQQLQDDLSMFPDLSRHAAYRREQAGVMKEILSFCPPLLATCRQAADLKQAQWPVSFYPQTGTPMMNDLSLPRPIAKLLLLAALDAHDRGDDQAAVAILRDQQALAQAVDGYPTLIGHLVATSIHALASQNMEPMIPSLQANGRDQARLLMASLLDDSDLHDGLVNAFLGEQVRLIHAPPGNWAASHGALLDALQMPLAMASQANDIEGVQQIIRAARQDDYASTIRMLPPERQRWSPLAPFAKDAAAWDSIYARMFVRHYRVVALERMAALAIAIRLYELDHGHRPGSLGELVPTYLPKLPADPFNPGGGTFQYLPLTTPAVLYSFGDNMRDDAAQYVIWGGTHVDLDSPDLPYFLNGDRPTSPDGKASSSQPATEPTRVTTRPVAAASQP